MDQPLGDIRPEFSPSTALWCPWCRRPFIGSVNLADGRFLHAACGRSAALDIRLVSELATQGSSEAWFWERYLSRLRGARQQGTEGGAVAEAGVLHAAATNASGHRSARPAGVRPATSRRLD